MIGRNKKIGKNRIAKTINWKPYGRNKKNWTKTQMESYCYNEKEWKKKLKSVDNC